jgi:hypothetical protein
MGFTDFFKSFTSSNSGNSRTAGGMPDATVNTAATIPTATIPKPTRKPTQSSGGFFGGFSDFVKDVGAGIKSGAETFFTVQSQIDQVELARDLEEIKFNAVRQAAKSAPQVAQIGLPTLSDFVANPRDAARQLTPAAITGSTGVLGGISATTLLLAGGAVFLLMNRRS